MKNLLEIEIEQDEFWWAGAIDRSYSMPLTRESEMKFDMLNDLYSNQINPLFLSSKGRFSYMPKLGSFEVKNGKLSLFSDGEIEYGEKGSLKEAYLYVCQRYFPPDGKMPERICFTAPQYCTWMELLYGQNQEDILDYARRIVAQGLPAGELILDDGWEEYYGHWDFDKRKFPDPKAMCEELKTLGFKLVLWIVPYVSPDSDAYRALKEKDCLIKDENGKIFITEWWNGYSAVLDTGNPEAVAWFEKTYAYLRAEYGISGLKMDGGDPYHYPKYPSGLAKKTACEHTEAYAAAGRNAEIKELRACVKNAGKPIVQRVADRKHSWDRERGLGGLVERMLLMGLMGYSYCCPDMVGGGLIEDYYEGTAYSEKLYCRYMQASALMPTLQFSRFFWKDSPLMSAVVKDMVALRAEISPYIVELAERAAATGEPIMRSLAYEFGERPDIHDEFLLGNRYLVAPVLEKGAKKRRIYLPAGSWKHASTGAVYEGGREIELAVGIRDLPYFIRTEV